MSVTTLRRQRMHGVIRIGPMRLCIPFALLLALADPAHAEARDPLVRVEPPVPSDHAPWQQVRAEQLSFVERLEEWGMRIEVERKDEWAVEDTPNLLTFAMSWESPEKFALTIGAKTPDGRAGFTYKGEFSEDETRSTTKGQIDFLNGMKFSGAIASDGLRGLGWEVGYEFERAFTAFKGKFDSTAPERFTHEVEVNLTKLCGFTQGYESGHAGAVKLKIHAEKYIRQFIRFAPRFVDFARGSAGAAANAVAIQLNPVLIVAAVNDDATLWSRQKALALVGRSLQEESPKGVRIHYGEHLLGELLRSRPAEPDGGSLRRLSDQLERAADPTARAALVDGFIHDLKAGFQAGRPARTTRSLRLVSLRSLVLAAEPCAGAWEELPDDLRAPGGIARVIGYQIDRAADDVLLIGEVVPGAPPVTIDDIVVGVRSAWRERATPFCSLDPDPADVGGRQHVRVGGVPGDSGFALTMLDADYLMKRMCAGLEAVDAPGYVSYPDRLRQAVGPERTQGGVNRFWFYPCPLRSGDIERSPDGTLVLFSTGMQVMSEEMALSHEGLLGTGRVDATADAWAAGLTSALPELEAVHASLHHLHGLFDLVLLARIWRTLEVESPWIQRLAALPYRTVTLPTSYAGLEVTVQTDPELGPYVLRGGVHVRTAASPRAMLITEQSGLAAVRAAASGQAGALVRQVSGPGLALPTQPRLQSRTLDIAAVLSLLRHGEADLALTNLQPLISADPFDPELWCLRAAVRLQLQAYDATLADAGHALDLDPEDPDTVLSASRLRFLAHFLTGRVEEALADIESAIVLLPENPRPQVMKGEALAALARKPEARAAYRQALRLDPDSVMAHIDFGLLEISDGWVVKGKKLIDLAQPRVRNASEVAMVKAAMAAAELGMAVLGDTGTHLGEARRFAGEVLADPSADPLSRTRALAALATLALIGNDPQAADGYAQQALAIAPADPAPLLTLAQWAHGTQRIELARRYLAQAEQISPHHPAVIDLHRLLGASP